MRKTLAVLAAAGLLSTGALVASAAGGTAPSAYVPPCTANTQACDHRRVVALEDAYRQHEHPAAPTATQSAKPTSSATTPPSSSSPAPSATPRASGSSTTPSVTPTPVASVTPIPSASAAGWVTAYSEDFTRPAALGQVGAVYGQSMRGYDGFTDTSKQGTYSPDKVLSVHDGMLDYHLHSEAGKPLVAAPVVEDYTGRTTARYTVRLKADRIPGYKIAFLLWPSSNDWNDGEIDWPEVGSLNDEKASPANAVPGSAAKYGYQKADFLPATRAYAPFTLQSGFHDYVIERTPGQLRFYADNTLVATITGAGVPTTAFRWTLQAETVIGAPANTTTSGHLYVDRLTVETR